MRYLLLALALGVLIQDPPRHDKYADDPHAFCFYGEADASMPGRQSAHPCKCKMMCAPDETGQMARVDTSECEMNCTLSRCLCHEEETCDLPEVKPK